MRKIPWNDLGMSLTFAGGIGWLTHSWWGFGMSLLAFWTGWNAGGTRALIETNEQLDGLISKSIAAEIDRLQREKGE